MGFNSGFKGSMSTDYMKLRNKLGRTGKVAVIANHEGDVRGM